MRVNAPEGLRVRIKCAARFQCGVKSESNGQYAVKEGLKVKVALAATADTASNLFSCRKGWTNETTKRSKKVQKL